MKLFTTLLAVVAASVASVNAYSAGFDLLDHTSQLNYYHPAKPTLSAAQTALPDDCQVDQVYAMTRHMTRYPSSGSYKGCMNLSNKIHDVIAKSGLPPVKELQFLATWNFSDVVPDATSMPGNITALGFQEGREFGQAMRTKYANLYSDKTTVWAGSVERVQLTAKAFMDGYFGASVNGYKNLVTSNSSDTTLGGNTVTPIDTCPKFVKEGISDKYASEYLAKVMPAFLARWQKIWPEFGFTQDDLLGMMDVCNYERNLVGKDQTRFCTLFTDDEWEIYAYNKDIGYYWDSSYGNPLARTVGYPYVAAVARLLAQPTTPYCQSVFVGFTHDTQLNAMMATLGIAYDKAFPSSPDRVYHSSRLVPMGARLVTERLECGNKRFVRVSVNEAVHPILGCTSGPGSSCPLDEYVAKIQALEKEVGEFGAACGVTSGATTKFELFDKPLYSQCKANAC